MTLESSQPLLSSKHRRDLDIISRYGFFILMLLCMLFASVQPRIGGANGVINGNIIVWYLAVPITYFEAGLICSPKALYSVLCDGYLIAFVMAFMYILMPLLARVASCLLIYVNVNIWLLKGMEIFYCMPPPFNVSFALSRLANADLATSIITTLICHLGGLLISPFLLYFMLGASTPPLVGINLGEIIYSTLVPLSLGIVFRTLIPKLDSYYNGLQTNWIPLGLLLVTAFHWFCDAITADSASLQALDVLLCVLIACLGQMLIAGLCWMLCSQWLSRNVLLAALFTSTNKSVGLGGWVIRGAYHGSSHSTAVNLPMAILPVAQLLLGSLLACWVSP
ncbi:sodium/bile acid cotransporter 7-like [Chelonus insularis]|uniref:sodium/bile acid cotransporter 7-like n=1 Tax=Chelonus insularis TaxID=460826 RepID=UPI00158A138B|nr:sodium/bile acid cotransporter 7-like [Chelonus insularis]XP_034934618.1 sodium/bile acid cotransporter 7-like [Chelonus insularis]XP_034934619.1 sodium/bile acid cotransporter 7-like [Chelonus insularis]